MTWLVRARLLIYIVVIGSFVEILGCSMTSLQIPFVSLRSTFVHVNIALALSVAVPVAWAVCLGRSSRVEQTAVRPVRRIVGVSAVVVVIAILLAGRVGDAIFGGDTGVATSRNVAAMVGMVLLAFTYWGSSVAALVPVCYFIASTLVGEGRSHRVDWWAIPIAPPGSGSASMLAAVVFVCGLAVFVSEVRHNTRF